MTVKAQISQERQAELENQIAAMLHIEAETRTIMREIDTSSLLYFNARFESILRAVTKTRLQLIDRMHLEKEAARAGRENGH